jgi:murein DD-endopeptidase MepM/ murein hydrolase activator NlpD
MLKDDGSSLLLTPSMLSSFDLHFTPFVTKCYPSLPIGPGADCSVPTSFPTQSYPVSLAETGAYCDLVYDRDVLYLDAPTSSGYNGAVLSNKSLHGVSAANFSPTLANALGWGMHNDISTYPTIERIDQGEGFAVYGWDFGDGWESPVSDEKRYKEHGALGRNGLIWPAIEGVNQGRPFRYACELPDPVLVRDGISSCGPFEEPTFYTAPIDALVEISQGPGGSFSHQLSQAWDIPVSVNTLVRAARAGEVFFVRESSNQNCTSLPVCQNQGIVGNGVRIVHADGTWANYWHFRQNGSFVSEGDWVARGEVIGASGNTGFSTGPHLHFETVRQVANVPVSSESSFYAKDWSGFPFGAPQVKACWEPVQGNVMDAIP